ncbi:MAG: hypothetical protein LH654_05735 [Thermoleophilia bacterium]|nr:hypothetical protein [Thermoleophilia bacterium]
MRLLLVASSSSVVSIGLTRAAVKVAQARNDVEIVAVCDTARDERSRLGHIAEEAAAALIKPLFGRSHSPRRAALLLRGLPGPVVAPPGGDPNAREFLELVRSTFRPDASLWFGCTAIARPILLGLIPRNVNYHNGELPSLRGINVTAWSVYLGHRSTGFSFHDMEETVDSGPVICRGDISVTGGATPRDLERAKTSAAIAALPLVLDAVVAGKHGTPQTGPPGYYGLWEGRQIMWVPDPAQITWAELMLRLRSFGSVSLGLPVGVLEVTRVRPLTARRDGGRTFVTADGVVGEADRFRHLPYALYHAAQRTSALRQGRAR